MKLTSPDKGWSWMVLIAAFGVMFIQGIFIGTLGIIHLALLDRYQDTNLRTSLAGSIFACANTAGGIVTSVLVDKYSCRVVTVTGSLLFTLGLAVCAFPVSLDIVIFSYGVLAGIGSSMTNTAAYFVVGYNFKLRQNMASGFSTSGISLGGLFMPTAIEMIREFYGNRIFFVLLAGIALQPCFLGFMYFPSYLEESRKHTSLAQNRKTTPSVPAGFRSWLRIMKNPGFVCFAGCLCLTQLGVFVMYLHFPNYVTTMGLSVMEASYLLNVRGVCSLVARLSVSSLVNVNNHNVQETTLLFGMFTFLALASMLLPIYGSSFGGLLIYCIFLGFYGDSVFSILNIINIKLVGLQHFASATGIEFAAMGICIFIGPSFVGKVIDVGGTYDLCFIITGILIMLGGILSLLSGVFQTSSAEKLQHNDISIDRTIDTLKIDMGQPSTECVHSRNNQEDMTLTSGSKLLQQVDRN
ncbi:monocarboxylate transporter 9-like [Mizuhopecten yessoensis]|uniref:Monocarboxylate transporter 4 n=1 Tax=Mizuhopecten yessoensis TaxID=6573 RepID=A0A210QQG1_MIZYE|nr:monocarboxylate transporter 9-like [Mizuhopecten yessoensis]XP_021352502.1 monocarboxylate transporter 9-like [Mizuhopecten yessoensis]XP_021352503.1 monocarboxylate transporter 9-like [Mizuhopecten yessoensis]OWF50975.1 Monocarboxylate transporter 4 [Mizuhopecten yessoensis]